MKPLIRRLARLESRLSLMPPAYLRDPQQRLQIVASRLDRELNLETSTCRRTLSESGFLSEVVRLDGSSSGLTDEEIQKFIDSFPIETA